MAQLSSWKFHGAQHGSEVIKTTLIGERQRHLTLHTRVRSCASVRQINVAQLTLPNSAAVAVPAAVLSLSFTRFAYFLS
jgi:hypothetical protein